MTAAKRNAESDLYQVYGDGRIQRRARKGQPVPARLTGLVTLDEAAARQRAIHAGNGALGGLGDVAAPARTEARAPAQTEARPAPGPVTSGRARPKTG